MLLKGYRTEIFRPEQNPQFESLHCIAHLAQDISDVLPHLNSRKCNEPTCLVFATCLTEGAKAVSDCPELSQQIRQGLEEYLARYHFGDRF